MHGKRCDIAALHRGSFFLQSPREVGLFLLNLANLALKKPYVGFERCKPVVRRPCGPGIVPSICATRRPYPAGMVGEQVLPVCRVVSLQHRDIALFDEDNAVGDRVDEWPVVRYEENGPIECPECRSE